MSGRSLLADIAERNRLLVAQWNTLGPGQRLLVVAIIGGFCLFLLSMSLERRAEHMAILRQQFHLPAEVRFERFQPGGAKSPRRPQIEGVVHFTPEQLRTYVAATALWSPAPLNYGGRLIAGKYEPGALDWRQSGPLPRRAGDPLVRWGNLALPHIYDIENGRYFCFAALRAHGSESNHIFRPCGSLADDDDCLVKVHGALDLDTRTLYMIVR